MKKFLIRHQDTFGLLLVFVPLLIGLISLLFRFILYVLDLS